MIRIFSANKRKISTITLVAILVQVFFPTATFALTGGPSQAEYESFEPAGATEMVNLATGDFVYNIPLLDVDGYPINISYHGGVNMEQEASWVGLGWSLSPGSINRGMRGLPDDFNGGGDKITETVHMKDNDTYGLNVGGGAEVVGFDFLSIGLNMGFGIQYNTYKGLGLEVELGVSGALTASNNGDNASGSGSLSGGLGLKISNQDGADFSTSYGLGAQMSGSYGGVGVGGSIGINRSKTNNSRRGLEADIISGSATAGLSVMGVGFSSGTGSSINLIPNTAYTPNMQFPTTFSGITGEIHLGGELYWVTLHGYTRANIFHQKIDGSTFERDAYGYLNMQNSNFGAVLDFNRDNDGTYNLECPKIPFANLTYDLFNANAQGLNELFRPYRSDFGFVHDNFASSGGSANDIGIEGNYGNLFQIGFNDYGVTTLTTSGPWVGNNNAFSNGIRYQGVNQLTNNGNDDESAYFKAIDELPIREQNYYNNMRGKELSSFKLTPVDGTSTAYLENEIIGVGGGSTTFNSPIKKSSREPRNSNFSFLNVDEANVYGIDTRISSYEENRFELTENGDIDESNGRYSHFYRNGNSGLSKNHISEVTVLKEDGSRYVYGVPIYNTSQKEVVFNTGSTSENNGEGTVNYTAGTDNSSGNGNGIDNFYLSKTVSPYAHSYLLTALLSKDYVDMTGNGLSSDDYGDYTKFNYTKASSNYQWRNPCVDYTHTNSSEAMYDPQWNADDKDNKGIYIYGEKELWYPHSIETKNYIAEFFTSYRDDARGVKDENGLADNIPINIGNKTRKLDKIVLYSKKDTIKPIKTVNFEYTYELCPQTPNSVSSVDNPNRGKLTLSKIYFTYGNSDKSIFSPYVFTYGDFDHDNFIDAGLNPLYNRTEMDRWGNYKSNGAVMNNREFPYATQNKNQADKNAAVWSLSSIVTPAKSKIEVYYEADDYSYIQDKVPGQMLTMAGFMKNQPGIAEPVTSFSNDLYSSNSSFTPNNYMIIDLSSLKEGGLLASGLFDAENILRNSMLPANGKLFFKSFVQLGDGAGTQEFVPGYSEFDKGNSGVINTGSFTSGLNTVYKYAYIKLNEVDIEDPKNYAGDNCNPISKAAWQMTRLYLPRIAYPGSEPGGNALSACAGLLSALTEVFTFKEKNNRLRKKSYGRSVNPSKSFARLNVPNMSKFGGGHRVSKIEISDNWNSMVNSIGSEASTTYGQTYNYSMVENNVTISSGVTSYEPLAGGDEISLRSPIEYSVARIAAPNDAHFFENPIGEAFFPPPTVIYRKVTVRNLDRNNGASTVTSNIGRTEYAFYTSKDFPIYSDYDGLQSYVHTPDPLGDLFSNSLESSVHLSQGSIIRLNNMHGKLKSVLTYQEGNNDPISGVRYHYKVTSAGNELDNTISVIDENGVISINTIGEHVEAVGDFRESKTSTYSNTITGNLNTTLITAGPIIFPLPIPSVFWGSSSETRDFYSATLNKVVTQQGILTKVETISNYATSMSENLLWDAKTTDVILLKTTTNFKDFDYSYHTPAHWVYKGMGAAFKNIGLGFKNPITNLATGIINPAVTLLQSGDEVQLIGTNNANNIVGYNSDELWVNKDASGNLVLLDRTGRVCNTSGATGTFDVFTLPGAVNYVLKVLRSGYRNVLDETVESISYSSDPRVGTGINLNTNVLEAEANEFSEDWQKFCSDYDKDKCVNTEFVYCRGVSFFSTNPYVLNTKGNWNEKRSYAYLGNRLAKNTNSGIMDIRNDGTFETYVPFFKYFSGSWKEVYNASRTVDYNPLKPFDKWIMNSELTKITSYGNEVEAKDAINRYSSSLYGYNHTVKTAVASNAKYREIGYDNFEDYGYKNCSDNHFNFKASFVNLINGIAHTGRYSMKINPGQCVSNTKQVSSPDAETAFGSNNVIVQPPTGGGGGTGGGGTSNPPSNLRTAATTYYSVNCIPDFSPQSELLKDQKYVLSLWVKESVSNKKADYTNMIAKVELSGLVISSLVKKSVIINGWQKLDYEFTIPANTNPSSLLFTVQNTGSVVGYFDDIRVQPFNATMVTYVNDPLSLRLWAELDERNFATFYEYDNEGMLVRVKKETERGIQTIQEIRNSFKKQ